MKIIGTVGCFRPEKGHIYLIEAMPLIIKQIPDIKCLLVGDGALLNHLKKRVRRMKLDNYVVFCGYWEKPYRIMSLFDVFVQPSISEGFGMSILEALVVGKPIVASNVGGIPEIIQDSKYHRLIPPADSCKLAEAIIEMLKK